MHVKVKIASTHAQLSHGGSRPGAGRVRNSVTRSYRSTPRRSGWTLIEMMVTISVMMVLTGVAVKSLSAMLIAERNGVQHVADLSTVSRLARQFRNDVHVASSIEVAADMPTKPLLQLTVAEGHQIDYQVQPAGLLRTERRPNQPAINELWRLKLYQFQCRSTSESPALLTLVLSPQKTQKTAGKAVAFAKEVHIDAVVGRDRH